MGVRLALMVRPGRRMAPRPAGAIFLIGELADGLTPRDLDRALTRGALEVTDWPAEPEAVVEPAAEIETAEPEAVEAPEEATEIPEAEVVDPAAETGDLEPVVVEEKEADDTPAPELDAPARVDPYDEKTEEERASDLEAARIADEEARDAAEEAKPAAPVLSAEDEVALLVEEYSKDELIDIAAGEETEISPRGTKPEIAIDIVRARRA